MLIAAAFLGLLAPSVRAANAPHCPDGKPPMFTGEPFRPLFCPGQGQAPAQGKVSLSSADIPVPIAAAGSELDQAVGRWAGMTAFGDSRFELLLVIAKAAKGYDVHFEEKDYILLRRRAFDAVLRPTLWRSKGRYAGIVTFEELPKARRKAKVYAGAPGPSDPPGFDRKFVLLYPGLADEHRLLFKTDKDAVRFEYDEVSPNGTLTATGELRRSDRKSL